MIFFAVEGFFNYRPVLKILPCACFPRGNSRIADKELIGGLRIEAEIFLVSRPDLDGATSISICSAGENPVPIVSLLRECFKPMTSNKNEITGTIDRKTVSRLANFLITEKLLKMNKCEKCFH